MTQLWSITCHNGITQCYLLPDTSEHTPPNPSHAGQYSISLPRRDGRLSWPRWLDSAQAGSRTSDLSMTSPTPNQCNYQDNQPVLLVVQSNGGTVPGEGGGCGVGEVAVRVDCAPVDGLCWRPQPGNSTLCSDGRSRKRRWPPPAAAVEEPSLPPPVAPVAMSVVDDSPDMTSLLLDDLTLTPTLLLLHDVTVPWWRHSAFVTSQYLDSNAHRHRDKWFSK